MPYVEVWVEPNVTLDDFTDDELRDELVRRARKNGNDLSGPNFQIPFEVAKMTLDDAAQIFRKQERYDLAFKLDEIRADYLRD